MVLTANVRNCAKQLEGRSCGAATKDVPSDARKRAQEGVKVFWLRVLPCIFGVDNPTQPLPFHRSEV